MKDDPAGGTAMPRAQETFPGRQAGHHTQLQTSMLTTDYCLYLNP